MGNESAVLIDWWTGALSRYPTVISFTCNLKQGLQLPTGWVRISPDIAACQTTWLFKNIDKMIFGNKFKRSGKSTVRVIVQESGITGDRLHIHGAIGIPHGISPVKIIAYIDCTWNRANWGYGMGDVSLCENPRKWIAYILKGGAEAVDLTNSNSDSDQKIIHYQS
jgi:hypothetical protein